jgi:hypothetical protein
VRGSHRALKLVTQFITTLASKKDATVGVLGKLELHRTIDRIAFTKLDESHVSDNIRHTGETKPLQMPKPKHNRLHDWFFGGPGKRLLLVALLRTGGPWTEARLAEAADLRRGSAAPHLDALVRAGVVDVNGRRYSLRRDSPLAQALAAVLRALEDVPDEELRPPSGRA